jgi:hypothetical protein
MTGRTGERERGCTVREGTSHIAVGNSGLIIPAADEPGGDGKAAGWRRKRARARNVRGQAGRARRTSDTRVGGWADGTTM